MDPFKKNQIGTTDFYLPYLGVGTAALSGNTLGGGLYGGVELDRAVTIINHAYDEGLRYFDTAPLYGTGKAEYRISLSKLPSVNRNSFIISSKVGRVIHPDTYQPNQKYEQLDDLIATNSWTEKNVLLSVEQSLKRLNLEKIDILYVHDPDMEVYGETEAIKGAFPTLIKLREEGLVSAIGCGMNQWEMAYRFVEKFKLDVILLAGRFTLLDQSAAKDFLPLCEKNKVSIVIGGPYNSGILAKDLSKPVTFDYEVAPPHLVKKAEDISKICNNHGVNIKAAALQFVLLHPTVVSAIPGVQSVAEVNENINHVKHDVPIDLWKELNEAGLIEDISHLVSSQ